MKSLTLSSEIIMKSQLEISDINEFSIITILSISVNCHLRLISYLTMTTRSDEYNNGRKLTIVSLLHCVITLETTNGTGGFST